MTLSERSEVIEAAVERMLRILPEVVGNLMASHSMYAKMNEKFYGDNKDFRGHEAIVREVVAKLESDSPTSKYDDILTAAIPKIRSQIALKSGVSMDKVELSGLNLSVNGLL